MDNRNSLFQLVDSFRTYIHFCSNFKLCDTNGFTYLFQLSSDLISMKAVIFFVMLNRPPLDKNGYFLSGYTNEHVENRLVIINQKPQQCIDL